jgi:hypothetical protein
MNKKNKRMPVHKLKRGSQFSLLDDDGNILKCTFIKCDGAYAQIIIQSTNELQFIGCMTEIEVVPDRKDTK